MASSPTPLRPAPQDLPTQHPHKESQDCTSVLEKIVQAAEHRAMEHAAVFDASSVSGNGRVSGSSSSSLGLGGPLSVQELSQLTLLCTESSTSNPTSSKASFNRTNDAFAEVDGSLLATLLPMLEQHVASAATVDLVAQAGRIVSQQQVSIEEWLCKTGSNLVVTLRNGLEAASVLLSIMTSPQVDRRFVSEDSVDACISLLRHALSQNLLPALTGASTSMTVPTTDTSPTNTPLSAKKRRKTPTKKEPHPTTGDWNKVHLHILSTSGLLLCLFEKMQVLLERIPLDDRPLLTLCTAGLVVFGIEPASSGTELSLSRVLQVSAISLLTTAFHKYPLHRTIIMEDLFPLFLKLPTSKRFRRTYVVGSHPMESSFSSHATPTHQRSTSSSTNGCQTVQAMTVLLLSLLQSCVEMPTMITTLEEDSQGPPLQHARYSAGLAPCHSMCTLFCHQLLDRCSKRGEDGGPSEFRPILHNLVEDLLVLWPFPEYPAAQWVTLVLFQRLSTDVLLASSLGNNNNNHNNKTVLEATYATTAFDAMGKISGTLARLLAHERENPLSLSMQRRLSDKDDAPTDAHKCPCGRRTLLDTFMVKCGDCWEWFHAECVGVTKDMASHSWTCDSCRARQGVFEETKTFALESSQGRVPLDASAVSDTHVLRQLILKNAELESYGCAGVDHARKFHLAGWIKELDDAYHATEEITEAPDAPETCFGPKVLRDYYLSQWDGSSSSSVVVDPSGNSGSSLMDHEGCCRMMRSLMAKDSDLARSFPSQLGLLVQLMGDEAHVSLRKHSVRAISQVVEADSSLMLHPSVKNAVSERFRDDAKSVREAAVALVGSFVVQTPDVANAFHSSLLPCLTDDGVSVKKRAVRIFRDILTSNSSYQGRAAACAVMLKQAADPKEDDSVRDLIYELITELWLVGSSATTPMKRVSRLQSSETATSAASVTRDEVHLGQSGGPGVVSPSPAESPKAKSTLMQRKKEVAAASQTRCESAAEQIVEVIEEASSRDALTSLMRELMSDMSDADKDRKSSDRQKRKDALHRHCSGLVDALVEHLLRLEEKRPSFGPNVGKKLVAIVRAIGVFAEVAPEELVRHIDTLLPYLKADNDVSREDESFIVSECSDILYRVAPVMKRGDILSIAGGSVSDDLVNISYKFGSGALNSAVRALSTLACHKDAGRDSTMGKKLMKLVNTFYGYLQKNESKTDDFSSCDQKIRSNIQRALSVLGAFCRSHKDEGEQWYAGEGQDFGEIMRENLSWANVSYGCFGLFFKYLHKSDANTKSAALRALTGICMSHPRVMLMLEQDGTIVNVMSKESPPELQLESLRCWRDIILTEDKRLDSGDAKKKMESDEDITLSKRVSGDQDGDATLIGGVLTQHASRLFEMTQSQDSRIRYAAVELLGHLLRQGLLNPMETVPFLFALQGDVQEPHIRSLALQLLVNEAEKRPEMIRQRAGAGIKQACRFQRTVYPTNEDVTAIVRHRRTSEGTDTVESIFAAVFKECIRKSKKERHGLYLNLLDLFDIEDHAHREVSHHSPQDLSLLSFAAQVLAHLPYNTSSDPLFVIYHISNTVGVQGTQLVDRLASFLRPYGLSTESEHDVHIAEEDSLEKAAKSKSPSRNKGVATVMQNSRFDWTRFSKLCAEASAMALLLRLKAFLRKVYNLSETRCLGYQPDAKERACDKAIGSQANVTVFDSKLRGVVGSPNSKSKSLDKDGLIRQYAEFRALMRVEHQADARMSDSEDDSNPKKRKGSESD